MKEPSDWGALHLEIERRASGYGGGGKREEFLALEGYASAEEAQEKGHEEEERPGRVVS